MVVESRNVSGTKSGGLQIHQGDVDRWDTTWRISYCEWLGVVGERSTQNIYIPETPNQQFYEGSPFIVYAPGVCWAGSP